MILGKLLLKNSRLAIKSKVKLPTSPTSVFLYSLWKALMAWYTSQTFHGQAMSATQVNATKKAMLWTLSSLPLIQKIARSLLVSSSLIKILGQPWPANTKSVTLLKELFPRSLILVHSSKCLPALKVWYTSPNYQQTMYQKSKTCLKLGKCLSSKSSR